MEPKRFYVVENEEEISKLSEDKITVMYNLLIQIDNPLEFLTKKARDTSLSPVLDKRSDSK